MKKRWKEIRILFGICAALGWWGVLYPELTLLPDTYKIVIWDEFSEEESFSYEWIAEDALYREILEADADSIVFKSKLWESISALIEKLEK